MTTIKQDILPNHKKYIEVLANHIEKLEQHSTPLEIMTDYIMGFLVGDEHSPFRASHFSFVQGVEMVGDASKKLYDLIEGLGDLFPNKERRLQIAQEIFFLIVGKLLPWALQQEEPYILELDKHFSGNTRYAQLTIDPAAETCQIYLMSPAFEIEESVIITVDDPIVAHILYDMAKHITNIEKPKTNDGENEGEDK